MKFILSYNCGNFTVSNHMMKMMKILSPRVELTPPCSSPSSPLLLFFFYQPLLLLSYFFPFPLLFRCISSSLPFFSCLPPPRFLFLLRSLLVMYVQQCLFAFLFFIYRYNGRSITTFALYFLLINCNTPQY